MKSQISNLKSQIDILGLGCTAVDELIYVPAYPPADAKARVLRRERQCGGLTATALVAAARLGAKCAYAGVLGEDGQSQFVLDSLQREGVDVSHVLRRAGVRPIQSLIVVGEKRKTRNIFFSLDGVVGAGARTPAKEVVRSAGVLLVDLYGVPGMIRAARLARAAGIPVVGDFERSDVPGFDKLLPLVDHLILPSDFACKLTGATHPATAVARLWTADSHPKWRRSVVVVTCGANGCYYIDAERKQPEHGPAFKMKVSDTTGCGDVFHGAYAAALARGMALPERIRFAAAAAALKATQPGGQAGIPTRAALEEFLHAQTKPPQTGHGLEVL